MLEDIFDSQLELKYWISCDFSHAHDTVSAATHLLDQKIKLNGMVHAVACHEAIDPRLISTLDMAKHFTVNVFGPLLFTLYCHQANVLPQGSRVIFLLDQRKSDNSQIMYSAAKSSTQAIVSQFYPLFDSVDFMFVAMPNRRVPSGDDAEDTIVNLLQNESCSNDALLIV
jgi:hypothetical protein